MTTSTFQMHENDAAMDGREAGTGGITIDADYCERCGDGLVRPAETCGGCGCRAPHEAHARGWDFSDLCEVRRDLATGCYYSRERSL